jgi:predicted Fe-S protein YdhL (DUF1289 family)
MRPEEMSQEEREARRQRRREARLRTLDTSIPSPCVSVCMIDDRNGWCLGCKRTIDEIRDWPILSAEEKTAILEEIEARKA